MKKVMILGAGIYQVPLIQKAKEMGLSTLVVSYPGPYPGFDMADQCLYVDTRDQEAILMAARENYIDGICTTGTDVAVRSLGYVCDSLGLPGLSYKAALNVTDKFLMRTALRDGGAEGIPFFQAFRFEDALDAFQKLGGPVMVKAVDSSGSRGIIRVDAIENLKEAYQQACSVTRLPYVMVEQCVDGHEIGVDGFILQGKIKLLLPHDKFVVRSKDTTLPGGHAFPYSVSEKNLRSIQQVIEAAITALGLDNCAFNADVMISQEKAYLLEIGGRCGATCIPELISAYCGFDYYQKILMACLGLEPDFSYENPTPCMARLLFSPIDGVITKIDHKALQELKHTGCQFSLDYPKGAFVEKVKNGTDRIGQCILETGCRDKLDSMVDALYGALEINHVPLIQLWNDNSKRKGLSL